MAKWEIDSRWGMIRCVPDGTAEDNDGWYTRLMDELKANGFTEKELIEHGDA